MNRLSIRLARRNVFRQGLRCAVPMLATALSCLVVTLIGGFYLYLFDSLEQEVVSRQGHLWITGDQLPPDLFADVEGIAAVAPRRKVSGVIGFGDRSAIFSGRAVDPSAEEILHDAPRPVGRIGVTLAQSLGLTVGDWVSGIAGNGGFSLRIDSLVHTDSVEMDRYYLEIPFESLGQRSTQHIGSIHVLLKDPSFLTRVREQATELLSQRGATGWTITDYRSSGGYIDAVEGIYWNNLLFVIAVISVTVFFSVASSFTMSITERTRELGAMRSFGADLRHIGSLFQTESLFLAAFGAVLGGASAGITGAVINALGGIPIEPPPTVSESIMVKFKLNLWIPVAAAGGMIMIAQLSTLWVARRLGRLSIVQQLEPTT